jgi:alkanesulfonate monooxygenase SsuD/methylene tetrahydromethanopterin reductase-like flavin-dependent oxidoreductase (luciferase family)
MNQCKPPTVGIFFELEVRGRTREVEQQLFANAIKQTVHAEELGFKSVWCVEHHFTRGFSHASSPDLFLAAVSQVTSEIRLGLGVVLLPFNHPIRTAERVATLDVLSNGRVEFGTGRGASPLEYQAFGKPFEQSRALWEDNLAAVLAIWSADGEPVEIRHDRWLVPDVAVYPRPVQEPYPPVWVASISTDGFKAAGAAGLNLLCMPMVKGLEGLASDIAAYKEELAKHGFDPDEKRIAMGVPWVVAPTLEEAKESTDSIMWYIRRQINLVQPPDVFDARHATHRVLGQLAAGMPPEKAIDVLRENRMVVCDGIEGSRLAFDDLIAAGATDVLCQFQVGGLAHDRVMRSMELFAADRFAEQKGARDQLDEATV